MSLRYSPDVIEGKALAKSLPKQAPCSVVIPIRSGESIFFSDDLLSRHVLLVGGIGQGKTNAIRHLFRGIVAQMTKDDITVVFDTKGDYAARFRRPGDVVINDLSRDEDESPWNIMGELQGTPEQDREEILSEIGHTLFDEMLERTQQVFFPAAAKDLFCGVLLRLISQEGSTNQTLRNFWDLASLEQIHSELGRDPRTRGLIHYISQAGPQTQGVLSHVTQLVRDVFIGRFHQAGDLSIRGVVRNKGGKCVFVEYDVATSKAQASIYRLIIDLAIKEALSRRRAPGRVFFIIDEFRLLPKLMHLDHGLNFGRECGLRFIVGMQNHDQVRASYGDEAAGILSAFGTVLAFRVGDPETREFIKGLGGRNRKRMAVPNLVPGPLVQQIVDGYVVEDHDVWDLHQGEVIAFIPDTDAPFRAQLLPFE